MPLQYYRIQQGLLLESLAMDALASAGIYYLAPTTHGWQIMAYRYADVEREIDHTEFWHLHVSRNLAGLWAVKVAHPWRKLRNLLEKHPYGFPRGRVVRHGAKYHVYHGSDIPNASRVNRGQIEAVFGIKGKAKWIADDHERCLDIDKMAVREALALEEDWCAV